MRNKKGFTLVELLAVIVILAVVSIVAIPIVINLIEESKKGALKDSVEGLNKAADMYYFEHMRNVEEGVQIEIINNEQTAPQEPKLNYKGEVKNGFVLISYDGKVAICVDDGKYYASRALDSKSIVTDLGSCTNEFDDELNTFVTVGSANYTGLRLNVKALQKAPSAGDKATEGTIGVVTSEKITGYYAGPYAPEEPKEGMVWVVVNNNAENFIKTKLSEIGVSYALQYKDDKWELKDSYIYNDAWVQMNSYKDTEYEWKYDYTGKYETFTAPFDGYYTIELWGASGGTAHNSYPGGLGAYTKGDIYLVKDEELYVYVGSSTSSTAGGWNGGGYGVNYNSNFSGPGGGGATDVRTVPTSSKNVWNEQDSLRTRIMVAAGGGAGVFLSGYSYGAGGAGGGLEGYRSENAGNPYNGTNGTQIRSGAYGGGFGYGGNSPGGYHSQGGGGGGWFGGAAGFSHYVSGGGGSSYISGHEGCVSFDSTLYVIGGNNSYTGKYFLNTLMIDGNGYKWTDKKEQYIGQPSYKSNSGSESSMKGNQGNGYARITFKNFDSLTNEKYEKLAESVQNVYRYDYMGYYQKFTAPKAGTYRIELWGASGGTAHSSYPGGLGAYTSGEITLKKGETLYVFVGSTTGSTTGGWNGGGYGVNYNSTYSGPGGGGATDVRTSAEGLTVWNNINSLKTRIMVAAGGGAGVFLSGYSYGSGGSAGGLEGYNNRNAGNEFSNTGGTQVKAGVNASGGFGTGGNSPGGYHSQGGGGGGWFGGSAGHSHYVSGAGGSSYISGHNGCVGVNEDTTMKNTSSTSVEDSYSYTGYTFKNTKIIDGNGYQWTTQKGSSIVKMPTHDHSTLMTGNSGNGYALITFVK